MTTAGSAYAIYFNEGPGYLFVANLGRGMSGTTMLVRSCASPHNLYVRKRVLNQPRGNECNVHHDELFHYPPFKYVPELIDWTDYGWSSYSVTTQFCNGGSLHNLLCHTFFNNGRPVAEIFLWKIFTQLLETLEYLHHQRSIAHRDILPQNVFLHWPDQNLAGQASCKHHLPDVYLGDFGGAHMAWPHFVQLDLRLLHTLLIAVGLGSSRRPYCLEGWKDRFPRHYSIELRQCMAILPEPWDVHGPNKLVDETAPANVLRAQILPVAQKKMAELGGEQQQVDYRFTKPSIVTGVKMDNTKLGFYQDKIDEPFAHVLVDLETMAVIKVEAKADFIAPLESGKGCVRN